MKKFWFISFFLLFLAGCSSENFLVSFRDEKTDLYGLKDERGKVVIPPQYEVIYGAGEKLFHPSIPEKEYLVGVIKKSEMFRIGRDGSVKFRSVYFDNGPDYYEEGLARFVEKDKAGKDCIGFHDRKGRVLIPPIYSFATPFRNGYAFVCKECWEEDVKIKKYPVVSNSTCKASIFSEGCCHGSRIIKGNKWGAINTAGKEVVPPIEKSQKNVEALLKKKFQWIYEIK